MLVADAGNLFDRSLGPHSADTHAGRGVVMQRLGRFRQRRVLLPDHHAVGPVGRTHRDVAGVAAKSASELRIADDHEGTGFRNLVKVCHSLGLRVAVVHQPVLALEVRRRIGVERFVAVKQDPAFEMQKLKRLEPDPGEFLERGEPGIRPGL
jgi:hypothetical protein